MSLGFWIRLIIIFGLGLGLFFTWNQHSKNSPHSLDKVITRELSSLVVLKSADLPVPGASGEVFKVVDGSVTCYISTSWRRGGGIYCLKQ